MTTETDEPTDVTPEEEPAETAEQPVPIEESEEPKAWEPDEAYKGLQRRLERERKQREDAEAELARVREQQTFGQPQAGIGADPLAVQAQQLATPVYHQSIAEGMTQEQATRAYNLAYQAAYANLGYQQLQQQSAREKQERESQLAIEALQVEMREMAQEAGVDPNDPDLDYGDTRQPDAAVKMRDFRRSLRDVKARTERQAPAAARRPPDRSAGRVERQEPTGTANKPDAEKAKQAFSDYSDGIRTGRIPGNRETYAEQQRLRDKALEAGAVF